MEHKSHEDAPEQQQLAERRERIDNETSSEMHPPRTVAEQVEQLDPGTGEHRRRDPLRGAEMQRQEREPVSGGGPAELENEGAESEDDTSTSETRQHFGTDVQGGPSSTGANQNN